MAPTEGPVRAPVADASRVHRPAHPVRVVTAASLFDGHDAAINIIRRLLQAQGAEVVHLGHNRSVQEVVTAAVQEDAQAVAVSSYQGGHIEYFEYLLDQLAARGRPDVRVYGGGGGVIVPAEADRLHRAGVARIFRPEDGQRLGLEGMVNTIIQECDRALLPQAGTLPGVLAGDHAALARAITGIEDASIDQASLAELRAAAAAHPAPALGVTGTGGSGKSSLTDELVRRLRLDQQDKVTVAVLAVDPTRSKSGGALLGDRLRMNSIASDRVYMRSLATRGAGTELPAALPAIVDACRAAGFDLVIVETPGVGQGGSGIVRLVDRSLYVMTPEYGAPTQLEKIDMLDYADAVAINKFDRRGAADALRDVRRQLARAPERRGRPHDQLPVFGTVASRFNDDGVTALYEYLRDQLAADGLAVAPGALAQLQGRTSSAPDAAVPPSRSNYLAEVAKAVRAYHARTAEAVVAARRHQQAAATAAMLAERGTPSAEIDELIASLDEAIDDHSKALLDEWPALAAKYGHDDGGRRSLAGTLVPRVSLPRFGDDGDLLRFLRAEHLPGHFPYTAGVFPFRRASEGTTR
ncbi:MAG TPA: cobalamin-dependent protein, partial [Acidimicrobiales bacterium]|nr:cobalamin-dependent protein [Acidimicrobiales bacterium]